MQRFAVAIVTGCAVLTAGAAEKQLRINLGTLAPRGSVYHQSLQAMVEQWRKAAGGVKLVVYPDGTQGSEADMVRLMNVNALQAGLLTAVGLSKIEPGVVGLQYAPMLFRDLDEVDAIQEQLRPMLEKRMQEKGYEVLFWVNAGWVRYFSSQPLSSPEELKKMKIFVWAGDVVQMDMMRKAGYRPVGLETGDILPGLKTGLINTAAVPPIFALAGQLDMNAPHMLNLNWAPLVGACVVKKDAWDKIPAETRRILMESATTAGKEIQAKSRLEGDLAVEAMKKRGLTVHPVLPEVEAQWRAAAEQLYPDIRGQLVPNDIFDEVQRLVKARRALAQTK
jgi:TRAP-type C4-dicarboxylate transport system substrate-binding protein